MDIYRTLFKDYYRSRLSSYTGEFLILGLGVYVELIEQFSARHRIKIDPEYLLGNIIKRDFSTNYWMRELMVHFTNFAVNHFDRDEEDFILTEIVNDAFDQLLVKMAHMLKHDLEAFGATVNGKLVYEFWGIENYNQGIFIKETGFTIQLGYNG